MTKKIGLPLKRVSRNEAVQHGRDVLTHTSKHYEREYMRSWMDVPNQRSDSEYYDAHMAFLAHGTIPRQYADLGNVSVRESEGHPNDEPSQTPTPISLKRKAAAIALNARSSESLLPSYFGSAAIPLSHLPATICDTQSSPLPLPPGYSYGGDPA
jgi:hypothetical protein